MRVAALNADHKSDTAILLGEIEQLRILGGYGYNTGPSLIKDVIY